MTLYERLTYLIKSNKISQGKLEKELGFSNGAISKWKNAKPAAERLQKVADYFGVSVEYLVTGIESNVEMIDNLYAIEVKTLPLLGEVACGEPRFANEERESYILAGTKLDADFCVKAKGNSMINARIYDGDIVFVRRQDMVNNGEIAVVSIDDEVTLKRVNYYPERKLLILHAENPEYKDLIYQNEELDHVHILGKAVAFQSDVR